MGRVMDILPAIDLRGGKCVRLLQGDYSRQIDYRDDPVAQARQFEDQGAHWLHVVDLEGARSGKLAHGEVIRKIVADTTLQVEVGGGMRDESVIAELLDAGVAQVVVGTRALEDIDWFEKLVKAPRFAGRMVLGLDGREGRLSTRGWTQASSLTVLEMAQRVNDWPLAAIVYTDIARDGMLTGPNVAATDALARACKVPIIASGGVGKLADIEQLAQLNLRGIIVGRALYEDSFTLSEALAVVTGQNNDRENRSDG